MGSKVGIMIVVVAMIVAGLGGYAIGRIGSSDGAGDVTQVSQSFIESLAEGDVESTYSYISESFQARNGKDYIEGIAKSVKTDNLDISEEEVFVGSGDTKNDAIYLNTVENLPEKDGNTKGSFIIRLVNESGEWKVDSAQIFP